MTVEGYWFKTRPVKIQAFPYTGHNTEEVLEFCEGHAISSPRGFIIKTLEGEMRASKGDWIIKGLRGEFYPCKVDVFEKKYEAVAGLETPMSVREVGDALWIS